MDTMIGKKIQRKQTHAEQQQAKEDPEAGVDYDAVQVLSHRLADGPKDVLSKIAKKVANASVGEVRAGACVTLRYLQQESSKYGEEFSRKRLCEGQGCGTLDRANAAAGEMCIRIEGLNSCCQVRVGFEGSKNTKANPVTDQKQERRKQKKHISTWALELGEHIITFEDTGTLACIHSPPAHTYARRCAHTQSIWALR